MIFVCIAHTIPDASSCIGGIFMNNQQTTNNQTSNQTSMSQMGNKCKVAFSDLVDRFLSSGVGIDYQITTQMLQKSSDGTWTPSSQGQSNQQTNTASQNQASNTMIKQGKLKIATVDLVVGMVVVCLLSGIYMGMRDIKKMFR